MKCETDAEQSKARNFFEKTFKKGPKIHCLALKLYTGPPNCITEASKSVGWGARAPGDPPLFILGTKLKLFCTRVTNINFKVLEIVLYTGFNTVNTQRKPRLKVIYKKA